MAQYKTLQPPVAAGYPHARARWLAEQAGAIVYRRADGTVIESRETWPVSTAGLTPVPVPVPGTWTRLTPEP